jgi:hypothetical protein
MTSNLYLWDSQVCLKYVVIKIFNLENKTFILKNLAEISFFFLIQQKKINLCQNCSCIMVDYNLNQSL